MYCLPVLATLYVNAPLQGVRDKEGALMRRIVLVLSVAALMVAMVAGPTQAQQEFVKPPCPKDTYSYNGYCLDPPYLITDATEQHKCPKGTAMVKFGVITYGCALLKEDPKESGKNEGWGDGAGGGKTKPKGDNAEHTNRL
jgi:hypothetical protein